MQRMTCPVYPTIEPTLISALAGHGNNIATALFKNIKTFKFCIIDSPLSGKKISIWLQEIRQTSTYQYISGLG